MERKKLPKLQRVELKNATIQFKKQLREYKANSRDYKDKLNSVCQQRIPYVCYNFSGYKINSDLFYL